jgi:hypothetical protein
MTNSTDPDQQRRQNMAPRGRAAVVEPEPEEEVFDGSVYADKEPTHTMLHFANWLIAEVFNEGDFDAGKLPKGIDENSFREGVRLGGTLRMIFQASDYWKEEREAHKAEREEERKEAAAERRAAAKAKAEEEAEDEKPAPKARGRASTTTSSSSTTKAAPARRGRAKATETEAPAPKPARRGRASAAATAPF